MARPRTPLAPLPPGLVVVNGANGRRPRRAIRASGVRLQLDDQKTIRAYRTRTQGWQERGWLYNDEVPELGFAHDYVRDALSKVRIFAGIRPAPDEDPQPIEDSALAELCDRLLERLEPHSELMGGVGINLDITGDVNVALIPDDDEPDGEKCRVLSIDELKTKNGNWFIFDDENDQKGLELDRESSFIFRIWTPHPRYSNRPTSPMRRLDTVARELLILTRLMEGVANARLAVSGLLGIPEELSLASATEDDHAETTDAGDGEAALDPFVEDFIAAASAAISDPTSAAAALPIIVRGPGEWMEKIKFIDLARPFDPVAAAQRMELLGRIGNGANLPREVILGVGGTNHWNAEQIDDQTWRVHLEPRAQRQCAGIAAGYLRPMLLAEGVDIAVARTVEVWYDPTSLFAQPDPAAHAEEGHDRILISDAAWRRVRGFDESDAPDDAEVAAREARAVALKPAPFGSAPDGDAAASVARPVVAGGRRSSSGNRTARLGLALVTIERDVRTRLQSEADHVLARALERASGRLASAARRVRVDDSKATSLGISKTDLRRTLERVPTHEILTHMGFDGARTLAATIPDLLDDVAGTMRPRYMRLVTRAQHAAIDAAARETQRTIDADARDEFDTSQEEDRNAGWLLLAAGLTALAHEQLFSPAPSAPPLGEFDDTVTVPTGLVRAALDRAGGAAVSTVTPLAPRALESQSPGPGGAPNGGGATAGPDLLALFKAQLGIIADSYEWVYGDTPRTREFEPHRNLDGEVFESWDAAVLTNNESPWLDVAFYKPGDHPGCGCDFAPTFTQAEQE